MFLQVYRGRVTDPEEVHAALHRWSDTLGPGWVGTTAGVTSDGRSITLVRFESADTATPTDAGDAWWAQMCGLSAEPMTRQDCPRVMTQLGGDSADAGYVQVLQGRISDLERLQQVLADASGWQAETRTDIMGGLMGLHGDGGFTQAVYFSSEDAAWEGARTQPPVDTTALDELVGDLTFFDLRRPWAYSPR
ncbi:MAG TPA: hypothetical protein VGO94_02910 [Mycobacteriales bacterium]|jgi:hypothetical protein|nr:hypothetical protein [Cryptosporangiaceae bacterium]MDQ1677975.1 hypothetical protein [Actinomycetota bacterium]HEV7754787.1 hypothetical protein [Mycobacteriales bacterium]